MPAAMRWLVVPSAVIAVPREAPLAGPGPRAVLAALSVPATPTTCGGAGRAGGKDEDVPASARRCGLTGRHEVDEQAARARQKELGSVVANGRRAAVMSSSSPNNENPTSSTA